MVKSSVDSRLLTWFLRGEVGASSKTLVHFYKGEEFRHDDSPRGPIDVSDFRRCYLLVQTIPEIKEVFPLVAERVPSFKGVIENWDAISAAYERERGSGKCPETYLLLKEALKN